MRGLIIMLIALAGAVQALAFDHSYTRYASVLTNHVRGGGVTYASLKSAPANLDGALDELAAVTETDFKAWPEAQQLAFLINLYNAATLKLVVEHYPVKSIRKIGGVLESPWKLKVVRLFGSLTTLDYLEHNRLRQVYREARIHFAIVCAAQGCPSLRNEPFVGDRLDAQLAEQTRQFLSQRHKNRVDLDTRTLWLSPIFDWFASDFTREGQTVPRFVAQYLPEAEAKAIRSGDFRVRFTDYDWSLNQRD
jgi:hypothetical protein